jgi:hypothetical protein
MCGRGRWKNGRRHFQKRLPVIGYCECWEFFYLLLRVRCFMGALVRGTTKSYSRKLQQDVISNVATFISRTAITWFTLACELVATAHCLKHPSISLKPVLM